MIVYILFFLLLNANQFCLLSRPTYKKLRDPGGGGGGGGYSPQILVGMCRVKVKKMARAPDRAPGRA